MKAPTTAEKSRPNWSQRRALAERRALSLLADGDTPQLHLKFNYVTLPARRLQRKHDLWLPPDCAPDGWEHTSWVRRVRRPSDGWYDIDVESHPGNFRYSRYRLTPDQDVRVVTGYWRFADLRPGDWFRAYSGSGCAFSWDLCMDVEHDDRPHRQLERSSASQHERKSVVAHDPRMRGVPSRAWRDPRPLRVVILSASNSSNRSDPADCVLRSDVQPWDLISIATEAPETDPMPELFRGLIEYSVEPAVWRDHWQRDVRNEQRSIDHA